MYDTNERVAQVKERAARIQKKKEKRYVWRFAAVWSAFWVRSAAALAAR